MNPYTTLPQKGDRVIVIKPSDDGYKSAPEGSVGTVLESCHAPWILFDYNVGTPYSPRHISVENTFPESYTGRLDCVKFPRLAKYRPSRWARFKEWCRRLVFQIGTVGERK